ncbi:P-type conjugative transfer protein TrbJ [Rhizorhabdus dicambivorans]|uniref:P-type conjugative transfer protein TrbJ n=1 Tax=Rhizorhabdus dicambivorans TaxID=1850238 RepID=A0A2A4FRR5_9SPHN|nr:P-type conjugative transfer protein TrbJ [Rhizorhabdus dicambivorans]ATE66366.1 P-type conjugative transfer protein TrbJ [Rhizorhabdus dicambivorans]PCE40392.1 P-type conjugative transfer protein TrbJ [Rhizorhabdus dicambivorans]
MNRRRIIIAALASAAAAGTVAAVVLVPDTPARAQLSVFDPSNYAQNILTAARTLQQVNQQIRQLQNEADMLTNMGKNLSKIDFPQLNALKQKLAEIDRLMGQAQGIDFKVDQLDERFSQLFPRDFASALRGDRRIVDARARLDASYEAFRHTMAVQNRVVENVRDDAQTLAEIVDRSQGAEGSLQAQQATNQLLALTAKQQFQVQQMMAAQFRSDALEQARRATQAAEARAATKKFLGSGSAYPPPE